MQAEVASDITAVASEACFNLEVASSLDAVESKTVVWLLGETFELDQLRARTTFAARDLLAGECVIEVGPRMSFSTAWCSNAVSIFKSCGLGDRITRAERSSRFKISVAGGRVLTVEEREKFADLVHDRMTEQVYVLPTLSLTHTHTHTHVRTFDE